MPLKLKVYAFELTTVVKTSSFIIVIKTWSFYLNQAHYPTEKHNYWLRNWLIRQKLESSMFAQRAIKKPYEKLATLICLFTWGFSVLPQLFSPGSKENVCRVSPSIEKKKI